MKNLESLSAGDFQAARAKATLQRILASLSGHSRDLMAFDEVREKLHLGGPVYRGVETVPLSKIVGSVNRYQDFDRLFLPTQSHTQDRWHRINRAWYQDISLPPVLLYKVGEVYFVVDGNHRVSVALSQGQVYIDAEVRECSSQVPLTSAVSAEDLVRLGERVDFLERSQLDRVRPGVEIETTILGGYDRLIEHIAVHRYFMGLEAGHEIPEAEAVAHWHDTLYQPIVDVVKKSDILQHFPGRTPADVYLWVMDHLHYLRSHPGLESTDPAQAASDFVERFGDD
jgi:hypothetical protein